MACHLNLIKSRKELFTALVYNKKPRENYYHLKLAGEWLLAAQSINDDGGYSHSYSLIRGWGKSYPETTGYIIPTMLRLGEYLKDRKYIESALKAEGWLLKVQQSDGSFLDLFEEKQIFDTAQTIEGSLSLYEFTKDKKFLDSAVRAGNFIIENQDNDGKWTRYSYNNIPHTYYSRVSANLLKLYVVTGNDKYKYSAEKNLLWTIGQQKDNGYFDFMGFAEKQVPYLHTIVYVLEGLLDSYKILGKNDILECLKKSVNKLIEINKERDFILYSQYDENWKYVRKEKCIAGLAQWAVLLLELYRIKNEKDYFEQAVKTIYYLKSKQIQSGSDNIKGSIPASIPIWGSYFRFSFNNWTVKFYIDALLNFEMINLNRGV